MELDEIRCFLKLCEAGSFTRAAQRCGVSQPTLTRSIQNLESSLGGEPLVVRDPGRVHLTELGQLMKPYFQRTLQRLEEAERTARRIATLEGATLSIGLMCTIGPTRMIDFFSRFDSNYPGVDFHLRDGNVDELENLLSTGEIDVAICCRPDEDDVRFHMMPLFDEGFVVAMSPNHRLAKQDTVRVPDLNDEKYLSRANCEYRDVLKNLRLGFESVVLHKKYSSERDDWIQSMVLAGLGITYIPEFAATVDGLVTRRLVDPEVVRTVKIVTVRGRPHSPAVAAFIHEAQRYEWPEAQTNRIVTEINNENKEAIREVD